MASHPTPRNLLLGVSYTPLGLEAAAARIAARRAGASFAYVTTPNAQHTVLYARAGGALQPLLDGAWLRLLDSRVLQILARLLWGKRLPTAPGSDLTLRLFDGLIAPTDPISVIGGSPELAARLRERWGLSALALHVPPMGFIDDPAAVAACIAFARAHPARLIFVVCGFPRSEQLCLALREAGGITGTGLCVGSALLFLAGLTRRAPPWVSKWGLEWLYRIVQEPRRLIPRLFSEQLPVLGLALRERILGPRRR